MQNAETAKDAKQNTLGASSAAFAVPVFDPLKPRRHYLQHFLPQLLNKDPPEVHRLALALERNES
jgi:hypothetical protein